MIALLQGKIAHIATNEVIIDVAGVGYLVSASSRSLARLGRVGEHAKLFIETYVREDQISLFGFIDQEEKDWFKLLCTVQGVGAKVCLNILSVVTPEELPIAIAAADKTAFTRADGVGPKLATRIITELKDKVAKLDLSVSTAQPSSIPNLSTNIQNQGSNNSDAVSALINLGYARSEAFIAVGKAAKELDSDTTSLEKLIQHSLKALSQG